MATTNRTLQFTGYAYGNVPVQITANINNVTVFNGPVNTLDQPMPNPDIDMNLAPVLFSVEGTDLFPVDFSGSYPMTMTVTDGLGAVVRDINSNYMQQASVLADNCTMTEATISGTELVFNSVTGTVIPGMNLTGSGIAVSTVIVNGSGTNWTVNKSQTVPATTITGTLPVPGNATAFLACYNGTPINSESTPDTRSSVTIDGEKQVPPMAVSQGTFTWLIPAGSVLGYNLNVGVGSVAQ